MFNKFAVKIFPIIISILLIFSFSCSNKSGNDKSEINKLEYHGFIFHEGKVSVFLKNYSKENYLITLNNLSAEEEVYYCILKHDTFLESPNDKIIPIEKDRFVASIDFENEVFISDDICGSFS